jgi:hypothetical protein
LEFGDLYIRFYKDGGQVLDADLPYEIATPYVEADLPKLKFAQVGDIITITHSSYAPRELRRYGNTNWQLATITFTSPPHAVPAAYSTFYSEPNRYNYPIYRSFTNGGLPTIAYIEYDWNVGITLQKKDIRYQLTMMLRNNSTFQVVETLPLHFGDYKGSIGASSGVQLRDPTEDLWAVGVAYVAGDMVRGSSYNDLWVCLKNHTASLTDSPWLTNTWGDFWWPACPGFGNPTQEYIGASFSLPEHKPKFGWPGINAPAGYTLLGFRLYRGMENVFGLIADVDSTVREFVDDGSHETDYTISPPTAENPFATDFPGVVSFFEQRRVMANTPLRPADVIASKVGDYNNFGWKPIVVDDDAITGITLASQSYEEIRWMLPLRALLLGTSEGAWVLGGAGGVNDAITAMSVKAR